MKAFEWEVREFPDSSERIVAPEGLCMELKWLDADEFAHWSSAGNFDRARAPRKAREWDVYTALAAGRGALATRRIGGAALVGGLPVISSTIRAPCAAARARPWSSAS